LDTAENMLERIIEDLIELSARSTNANEALKVLTKLCRQSLESKACTLVRVDLEQGVVTQVACAGFDEDFEALMAQHKIKIELQGGVLSDYNLVSPGKAIKRYDLSETGGGIANPEVARRYGLHSALCYPIEYEGRVIGFLNHFSSASQPFNASDEQLLKLFARQAESIIEQHSRDSLLATLEQTIQAMSAMAESRKIDRILMLLIRKSMEFTGAKWGSVRRINSRGELEVTAKVGIPLTPPSLRHGTGIAWKAIIEKAAQLANDVKSDNWYSEFSVETKAELAIPLLVDNVRVQEGTSIKLRSQPVGVLDLESPRMDAFTDSHIKQIKPLARQAALLIDWLESEQRLSRLRDLEREIVGKKNWRDVLQTVVTTVRDSLDFEHVNVSLVDKTHSVIKSEYVVGMSDPEIEEFKRMSVYSLDSSDIKADIVRTGRVEVPAVDDPRFHTETYERFKHRDLIRVFIPMKVPSTGEIIGTVEAGYRRGYRDVIYERDIQFLQSFVAYVVEAIEPSKRELIEIISHELRSSIVGIRSNADYLRLLWRSLSESKINNKLSDMLADSEILILNVGELEYFLGRTPQAPQIERISVVKDLIIKTVNQLTPLLKERRFDYRKIDYSKAASFRISIYAERAKLNQVVYNLLLNAIKYAEDDPAQFSIEIGVEDLSDHFVLRFADYGIGISEGLEEKIFDYAFRTAEARAKNVTGSGLGLTIARGRMRELGGDLVLSSNSKPTEFRVLIPKKLMEAPN
jgi:signal transduction histidine kinase/putative methionine-R-sulfoxide reductase with GAF domain